MCWKQAATRISCGLRGPFASSMLAFAGQVAKPLDPAVSPLDPEPCVHPFGQLGLQHVLDACWTDAGPDQRFAGHVNLSLGACGPQVSQAPERLEPAVTGQLAEQLDPGVSERRRLDANRGRH
jgi:hypothetical protein